MKTKQVKCPVCQTVYTTRTNNTHCQCVKPSVRCVPLSMQHMTERILGKQETA